MLTFAVSTRRLVQKHQSSTSVVLSNLRSSLYQAHSTYAPSSLGNTEDEFEGLKETTLTAEQAAAKFRAEHSIEIKGKGIEDHTPVLDFDSIGFAKPIMASLKREGFSAPSPIQAESWPIALQGRDLISVARTGSGKTMGFLLPAFQRHLDALLTTSRSSAAVSELSSGPGSRSFQPRKTFGRANSRRGSSRQPPSVLVLAPTRELTQQIHKEALKFASGCGIRSVCVYGGESKHGQINLLKQGVDVVIATPGRCNDLSEEGYLDLSAIKYLVLDEADRMLDMGFEPQIREIVSKLPPSLYESSSFADVIEEKLSNTTTAEAVTTTSSNFDARNGRQTLYFTATWPKEVQQLAREFVNNPVQVNIGDTNTLNANSAITQNLHVLQRLLDKEDAFFAILDDIAHRATNRERNQNNSLAKTIVFVARKSEADTLTDLLREEGFPAEALHGDIRQASRTRIIENFRKPNSRTRVLVATDVAARGLDVKDIEHVINYDFPNTVEDYVHRIGRTARGDSEGTAHTLLTESEIKKMHRSMLDELVGVLQRCQQVVPEKIMSAFEEKKRAQQGGGRGSYQQQGYKRYNNYGTGGYAPASGRNYNNRGGRGGGGGASFFGRGSGERAGNSDRNRWGSSGGGRGNQSRGGNGGRNDDWGL